MANLTPVISVGGETIYALQPRQLEALHLTPVAGSPEAVKHIGYGGSAGGGKSHLSRCVALMCALRWPGSTTVIFRRSRDDVKANHVIPFLREVPREIGSQRVYRFNQSELTATFENGSIIDFSYLSHDDHLSRYQGREVDCFIFEEATQYSPTWLRWLTGNRMRSSVDGSVPFALYPTNPGGVGHAYFKRLFVDGRYDTHHGEVPADYAFVQASVYDNEVLLERDPEYVRNLETLPEPYRSWLLYGDWESGFGMALEMHPSEHLIPAFEVPDHWQFYASFDWGYAHWWSFGVYAVDPAGRVYCIDTFFGKGQQPPDIGESILGGLGRIGVPPEKLYRIESGRDVFYEIRARGDRAPSIFEQFCEVHPAFRVMAPANTARIHGLNNMRRYLDTRNGGPRFMLFDTPNNRVVYRQLESIPVDPNNPEAPLKVDADPMDMEGASGDDHFDQVRYALASRTPPGSMAAVEPYGAFHPEVLKREMEEGRRFKGVKSDHDEQLSADLWAS